MTDLGTLGLPATVVALEKETTSIGFPMASDRQTGALLRALAASKPCGRLLELGTGTGPSTALLLDGMTGGATLLSVDNEPRVQAVARGHLGTDRRVTFRCEDGTQTLHSLAGERFDLIFADAWPGKYRMLDETLGLLDRGALYVIDDMLPQPNWPEGHESRVAKLIADLQRRSDLHMVALRWSTGIIVCTRRSDPDHPLVRPIS